MLVRVGVRRGDGAGKAAGGRWWKAPPGARWRTVLAWAGVGGWGVWAAARLVGVDRAPLVGFPAAPLLAVTPYVAAGVPIPIVLAGVLRRPRAALAGVLVAVGFAVAVLPRAVGGGEPAAHGPTLRVLSANLYFGSADTGRVVELLKRTGADVLSVQELPPEAAERLERAGVTALLPYKAVDPRPGAAGSGIYSRYPLRALPAYPDTEMAMPRAEITLPGGRKVDFTAVHPIPPISSGARDRWQADLRKLPSADPQGDVRILAGDFNASFDHAQFRALVGRGYADAADRTGEGLIPTWGLRHAGFKPPLTIDHVLADRRTAVRSYKVYDLDGSDHRAVSATLQLP